MINSFLLTNEMPKEEFRATVRQGQLFAKSTEFNSNKSLMVCQIYCVYSSLTKYSTFHQQDHKSVVQTPIKIKSHSACTHENDTGDIQRITHGFNKCARESINLATFQIS